MWFWIHYLFIFPSQNYLVSIRAIVDCRHVRWGALTAHQADRRPSHAIFISVIGGRDHVPHLSKLASINLVPIT